MRWVGRCLRLRRARSSAPGAGVKGPLRGPRCKDEKGRVEPDDLKCSKERHGALREPPHCGRKLCPSTMLTRVGGKLG